jgi:hypothetical protein
VTPPADADGTEASAPTAPAADLESAMTDASAPTGALVPYERPVAPQIKVSRKGDVDEWGRSEHMRQLARTLYGPIYRNWFRVEWEGLEKIPTNGGALLVANHAGAIPPDAPAIMHGIEEELGRAVYGLADNFFRTLPVVGTMWSRLGGLPAHPDNAYRLLREQRQLVLVFPEGSKGPGKTYRERYQLRRFGRGGTVLGSAVAGAARTGPALDVPDRLDQVALAHPGGPFHADLAGQGAQFGQHHGGQ